MLISKLPKSLVYFLFAQEGKETFRGKKAIVNNLKTSKLSEGQTGQKMTFPEERARK